MGALLYSDGDNASPSCTAWSTKETSSLAAVDAESGGEKFVVYCGGICASAVAVVRSIIMSGGSSENIAVMNSRRSKESHGWNII